MHISLKRLIDFAIEATRGTARPVATLSDLADRLGESPQTVNNWRSRGVSQSGALKAESVFGCSPRFIREGTGPAMPASPIQAAAQSPVAQPMSLQAIQTVPLFTWEQLMSEDRNGTLAESFIAVAPDDAMSPLARAGHEFLFKLEAKIENVRPGAGIIVRDRAGDLHLRQLSQSDTPGDWIAAAANAHYRSYEHIKDGVQIVAVLRAPMRGWEDF